MKRALIIIVNWNTAEITIECLRSLRINDVFSVCDVAVVDNDSADHSVNMISEEFGREILVTSKENVGFAAANNLVMKRYVDDYEYFLLLNSDTIVIEDVIQKSVAYMDKNPPIGVMGCRVLNTDLSTQETCSGYPTVIHLALQLAGLDKIRSVDIFQGYRLSNWNRDSEREVPVISGCFLLIRTAVARQVGVFDEDFFFFGEETDWCWRIRKSGWLIRFAPVGEIIHHGSVSARKLSYRRDLLLSNAIVRFNHKNFGGLAGLASFLILFCFNFSRLICHSIFYSFTQNGRERAIHFARVTTRFKYAWPSFKSRRLMDI